jgi:hypothetical protein
LRADGVNKTQEEKWPRDDNDDLDAGGEPEVIPADEDIQEGDEEKDEGATLPPAMPPGA